MLKKNAKELKANLKDPEAPKTKRLYAQINTKYKKANYIDLPLAPRSMVAQLRLSQTNAKADGDKPFSMCRLCKTSKRESSQHLLCECPTLEEERNILMFRVNNYENMPFPTKWKNFFKQKLTKQLKYIERLNTLFFLRTMSPLFHDPTQDAKDATNDLTPMYHRQLATYLTTEEKNQLFKKVFKTLKHCLKVLPVFALMQLIKQCFNLNAIDQKRITQILISSTLSHKFFILLSIFLFRFCFSVITC